MSDFPGSGGDGKRLDSLLAQLRNSQANNSQSSPAPMIMPAAGYYDHSYFGQQSQQPQQSPQSYEHFSTSIPPPAPTPPVHAHHPHLSHQPHQPQPSSLALTTTDSSNLRGPTSAPGASNTGHTSSLLSLLKFQPPPTSVPPSLPAPIGTPFPISRESSITYPEVLSPVSSAGGHDRGGSDLLAVLMGTAKPQQAIQSSQPQTSAPMSSTFGANQLPPSLDTQNYLLRLLNQPKPSQTESETHHDQTGRSSRSTSKKSEQGEMEGYEEVMKEINIDIDLSGPSEENSPEKPQTQSKEHSREPTPLDNNQRLFTYVNPFDQLAVSSPRNRTSKNSTPGPSNSSRATPVQIPVQILKHPRHGSDENSGQTPELGSAHPKRRLGSGSQSSSSAPSPLPDGRTQVEALIGIGASEPPKETVHEALAEVGNIVDKEVQEAITRVEQAEGLAIVQRDLENLNDAKSEEEFIKKAQIAAIDIREELEKDSNSHALDILPDNVAAGLLETINEIAQGHVVDSWESADAEDSAGKEEDEALVKVYNFPMRPWTSITVNDTEDTRPVFRDGAIIDIARLKKDFDQIDRTLVTATNNYIVYGMSKNGGIRVIRQDDGKDAKLFTETHDRIFNVATSVSSDHKEVIIGTGISGTVYWALIKDGAVDNLEDTHPETHGFALPPLQSSEKEPPGGVLKTRARKSAAHPELFAVGRGKYINFVWPSLIMKSAFMKPGSGRIADTEKYLDQHTLRVNTGKAAKDFTFSGDDTTIVSLDKAGRVKFWDVRELTRVKEGTEDLPANDLCDEIKDPILTLSTTPANERSWPTTVLFVDKLRPYQRGGVLRYMIVGMKQNHTLQLWDLTLGKPVQEVHLPHSKESDAVCSLLYHAGTGMIVVGHPTRNSIYFLHLSAPKYNLPKSMSQAEFIERIVRDDDSLPRPESTAVISGMREYSFANKGSLRSLDLLQNPSSPGIPGEPDAMFELYAMHSKGVTCITIKQADLGWTDDNKVITPVVAEEAGIITIQSLKQIEAPGVTETPVQPAPAQPALPIRIAQRPQVKEHKEMPKKQIATEQSSVATASKGEEKGEKKDAQVPIGGQVNANGTEKTEKKKRRKGAVHSDTTALATSSQTANSSKSIVPEMPQSFAVLKNGAHKSTAAEQAASKGGISEISASALKDLEFRVTAGVEKVFNESLNILYKNVTEDKRTQAAVSDAKQDAVLRLVSSSLSDNIETTLGRIVGSSVEKSVLPLVSDLVAKGLNEDLAARQHTILSQVVPTQIQRGLPNAVSQALQQPQVQRAVSDSVTAQLKRQLDVTLKEIVTPALTALTTQTAQKMAQEIQRQNTNTQAEQLRIMEQHRQADSTKIDQLSKLVTSLTQTVSTMASAQAEFQGKFLQMQEAAALNQKEGDGRGSPKSSRPSTALQVHNKSQEEIEYEEMLEGITTSMSDGDYENAVIQWLQTGREQEFFAKLFVHWSPEFLQEVSPLILLSLGGTISMELNDQLLMYRILWLETIISAFQGQMNAGNLKDDVRELVPKIMSVYVQRLEHLFMRISNVAAQDPNLKRLSTMCNSANRIMEQCRQPGSIASRQSSMTVAGSSRH